jgi:nucleoside-diphosphate-sugar epimerase
MTKTVAIAGAGDVAKYLVEELVRTDHNIVILSRANRDWFVQQQIEIRITDYTEASLTPLLKDIDVLISLLHDNGDFYNKAHLAMIAACNASPRCQRFIPSECGGNIEDYPQHPLFYVPTHGAIRNVLASQSSLEYTLFNIGWFMDYFISSDKSYMKPLPNIWPLDLKQKTLRLLGSGDEPVTFTAARDAARALAHLVNVPNWPTYTYVAGETTTWNQVLHKMEQRFQTKFELSKRSQAEIEDSIERFKGEDTSSLWLDYMDLWNATGAAGLPVEKAEKQRLEIFGGMNFMSIEQLMDKAKASNTIV